VKFFDAEHVTVIGDGHALHAIFYRLVDKPFYARLSVEYGVVGMYVQMYEIFHRNACFFGFCGSKLLLNPENTKRKT
jgi:hypothetical protein